MKTEVKKETGKAEKAIQEIKIICEKWLEEAQAEKAKHVWQPIEIRQKIAMVGIILSIIKEAK